MEKNLDIHSDIDLIAQIPSVPNMLEVICNATGMGFAAIARVTSDKWVACAVNDKIDFGLAVGGELDIETTICHEIQQHHQTVAIDNVNEDAIYSKHHTPKMYGLQSYISIPIVLKNGDFFGTLCAIDPRPALVNNDKTINMFKLFAELISFHLETQIALQESEVKLKDEIDNAEIREQFIAILGHDLRNPLHAISNAVQLQLRSNLDERNLRLAQIIRDASTRTRGLVDNILDFASGRLGGGIKLDFTNREKLEEAINEVITEVKIAHPNCIITSKIDLQTPASVDSKRIAQLFSNLLGNAITHGDSSEPIHVEVKSTADEFELCVINKGDGIPEETIKHLFKPFRRGDVDNGKEGLGLGLFISKEIAMAHNGDIGVASTKGQTCFTVKIPNS